MIPFNVDPSWYETYWYATDGRARSQSPSRLALRLATLVLLLSGGSLALLVLSR